MRWSIVVAHRTSPAERHRPAQERPQELVLRPEPDAGHDALGAAEDRADDEQRDGDRAGQHAAEAQQQAQPPPAPPAARLGTSYAMFTVLTSVEKAVDSEASASRVATVSALVPVSNRSSTVEIAPPAVSVSSRSRKVRTASSDLSGVALADEVAELAQNGADDEHGGEQREDREERALGRQAEQPVAVGLVDDLAHQPEEPA
jgi:hypothetical protein